MKSLFPLFLIFFALTLTQGVSASELNSENSPSYSSVSCLTPTGSVKVNYSNGNHGIVGNTNTYSGSDAVYTISENQLMQCFCPENGNGIQTDWRKVSDLSSDEAKILKNEDWIEVQSGSPWGLDDSPYMAKNIDYTCKSSNPGGPGDGRSDGRGSIVQAATGSNLASTGNIVTILSLLSLGFVFTLTGLILKRKSK